MTAERPHRGTIFLDKGRIVEQQEFPGDQFILKVHAPETARRARAGSFAHIQCDADIPMRRPLSIMRANADSGEIEFLYKIVGGGLRALSHQHVDDPISVLGPIGNGFSPSVDKSRKLMIGGGVGIPPMVFLAEQLHAEGVDLSQSLVLMGSEVPFPFAQVKSAVAAPGLPATATDGMPDLESLGVASRLASLQGYIGVYNGYVTALAADWLNALDAGARHEVEIFACGPEPMLEAAAKVAADFDLPCQLCLEEYMACAVGGCAGCAVPVHTDGNIAMKRVCVDGPVFEAATIYP